MTASLDVSSRIFQLAIDDLTAHPDYEPVFRIYVMDVHDGSDPATFDLYVGYTGRRPLERIRTHQSRSGTASRHFRNGTHSAGEWRPDLNPCDTAFATNEMALIAEGIVADHLAAQGLRVYSDRLGKGGAA